ncbi:hypothetical protein BX666DRAFT_1911679 [Dichotomocladium elegans]|nr:hypothetical protein BX666DRAFT_1911679 [Dichotomocladium elegans]
MPPAPDTSLLKALNLVPQRDYDAYCSKWTASYGYKDDAAYNLNGECGNWQGAYAARHHMLMEDYSRIKAGIFDSSRKPTFVSYVCREDPGHRASRGCGGLADRMNGMVSIFLYALLTDRAYLSHWAAENPMLLEDLFERPTIDWRFDPEEMRSVFVERHDYMHVDLLNRNWHSVGNYLFPNGPDQDFHSLFNASYIEWHTNRAFVIRTFQESTRYPERLTKMGITKENAFRCIIDYLFRPTFGSRQFINAYKNLFEMDSVLSIGIQIRTGDIDIVNPEEDQNTLEMWNHFLRCANELRDSVRTPQHFRVVYFLVTDSTRLRNEFASLNNDLIKAREYLGEPYQDVTAVITGLPIEHVETKTIQHKFFPNKTEDEIMAQDRRRTVSGVNAAVIENWLLSATDYRLISRQGFGKLAAFHCRTPNTTIAIQSHHHRKKHTENCGNPNAIVSFDTLSTWWSLG